MSSGGGFTRGDPMALIADLRRQVEALQRRLTEAQPNQPARAEGFGYPPAYLRSAGSGPDGWHTRWVCAALVPCKRYAAGLIGPAHTGHGVSIPSPGSGDVAAAGGNHRIVAQRASIENFSQTDSLVVGLVGFTVTSVDGTQRFTAVKDTDTSLSKEGFVQLAQADYTAFTFVGADLYMQANGDIVSTAMAQAGTAMFVIGLYGE